MNTNFPGAAWTALFCLSASLVPLGCADEATPLALVGPVEPTAPELAQVDPVESVPEEDLPALDADLSVWPVALEAFEILDATFEGERLLLAVAAADGVSIIRMEQRADGPTEVDRRRLGPPGTSLALVTIGETAPSRAALWIEDGHLRALALEGELAAAQSRTLAAEEGGAFSGPVVVATDDLSALVCLRDGDRPLCLRLDHELSPLGLHPFERRDKQLPRWVGSTSAGWLALMARCRNETCSRETLEVVALDEDGAPLGKARALPDIEGTGDAALVSTEDGLVLVGRRRGAGEHTAWKVTATSVMELDGRFSRVVGGFSLGSATLLVERGHLRMRKGFPVSSIDLRPLQIERKKALRHEQVKVERERFPEQISKHLPREVDQRFKAHGDALVFASPRLKGLIRAAIVRVSEVKPKGGT